MARQQVAKVTQGQVDRQRPPEAGRRFLCANVAARQALTIRSVPVFALAQAGRLQRATLAATSEHRRSAVLAEQRFEQDSRPFPTVGAKGHGPGRAGRIRDQTRACKRPIDSQSNDFQARLPSCRPRYSNASTASSIRSVPSFKSASSRQG
jgi:hypothetical protein